MTGPWGIAGAAVAIGCAGVHFIWHAVRHKKTPNMLHVVNTALYAAGIVEATNLAVMVLLSDHVVDLREHPMDGCIASLAIILVGIYGLSENGARVLKDPGPPAKNDP